MGRRLLSHVLISLAVFVLTATLFIWTIDGRVVNADSLNGELRKAGAMQEIATLLPEIAGGDNEDSTPEKQAEQKETIRSAVTVEYVDQKITATTRSLITFIREGEPQPVIDLSDFPERLRATGAEVDGDFNEEFAEPIQLNEEGKLDNISNLYKVFSMMKYVGLLLFASLMLAEWFVAERGKKLKRISRVFLYAGLWYALYWGVLIVFPKIFGEKLRSAVDAEKFDPSELIDSVVRAVQGLFAGYFLSFAIGCFFITTVLYLIRHFKHGDVVPTAPAPVKTKKR